MALAYYDHEQPSSPIRAGISNGLRRFSSLIFFAIAIAFALMLMTYNESDPSAFMDSTAPATNALGTFGAYLADPLIQLLGRGSWLLPFAFGAWGVRSLLRIDSPSFVNRAMFIPLALAFCAAWAATQTPPADWDYTNIYGLGGRLGDTLLGGFISLLPFGVRFSLIIATIFFTLLGIGSCLFVSGFFWLEIERFYAKVRADVREAYLFTKGLIQDGNHRYQQARSSRKENEYAPAAPQIRASEHLSAEGRGNAEWQETPTSYNPHNLTSDRQSGFQANATNAATLAFGALMAKLKKTKLNLKPQNPKPSSLGDVERAEIDINALPLAERISYLANRNAQKHQDMLKRRFDNAQTIIGSETYSEEQVGSGFDAYSSASRPDFDEPPLYQEDQFQPSMFEAEPVIDAHTRSIKPSLRSRQEAQPKFSFEVQERRFELPSLTMLQNPDSIIRHIPPREALEASARMLETVLEDYGVKGEIVSIRPGPVVTMYELEPAAGLKASRVIGLADDIARSMSAVTARVSTIPGRSVIGIELPNEHREMVLLREILTAKEFGDSRHPLPLALGKDIFGDPIVANLAKMPHLLIAGTTGSGKSVAINTMILSLLYHATPEDVRMIMIDPKMLELSVYDDIPHLLSPVVTDPKKAVIALKWVVGEMEERYRKMSKMGVRNIDGYNARVNAALERGEAFKRTVQTGFDAITGEPEFETEEFAPEKMPYIVVIVDEMADLMMVAGKEIEACIQRLAQMARASGIHIIMATQRPSVDVITGTIKANFPTRISFQVTSKIDSRTILGEMGAEQLLGQGDMLYMSGGGRITRVHGPFVSDSEVEEIVNHLKAQGEPVYVSGVVEGPEEGKAANIDAVLGLGANNDGDDALYDQAVMIVARDRKCSTSYIQRKLSIGYNKAAKIVEQMEEEGVVSMANHVGKREILVPEIN